MFRGLVRSWLLQWPMWWLGRGMSLRYEETCTLTNVVLSGLLSITTVLTYTPTISF